MELKRTDYDAVPLTVLAYVAGLLDGEGHIRITRYTRSDRSNLHPDYYLRVVISNTHEPVIRWLKEAFGGNVSARQQNPRLKPCFNWQLIGRNSPADFLRAVLPFLVIKAEQARIGIEYALVKQPEIHGGRLGAGELAVRDGYFEMMRRANKAPPWN